MRILLIHNYYQYWGGEDTYISSLITLLKKKGHEVYLYSKNSNEIDNFWKKIALAINMFWNFSVDKELSRVIKEFEPDIAHFHNIYPLITATAYRTCKKNNIPVIQHIHNYRFMCAKGLLFRDNKICERCVNKKFPFWAIIFGCYNQSRLASLIFSLSFYFNNLIKTFNLIDIFIFPSKFSRDYYVKNLGLSSKKTRIINHSFTSFKKQKKYSKKYFLFIGRLSDEKGIIQLLNIFINLPKSKLMVIGEGPLKEEVDKYKKYKNIKFLGFIKRENMPKYFEKAKAVVISSLYYEIFPNNVFLEAIRHKVPVLIPYKKDLIGQDFGKNFLYKIGDFTSLKEKIINFSKIEKFANDLYFKNIYEKYNTKKKYNELIKSYKEVIKQKN